MCVIFCLRTLLFFLLEVVWLRSVSRSTILKFLDHAFAQIFTSVEEKNTCFASYLSTNQSRITNFEKKFHGRSRLPLEIMQAWLITVQKIMETWHFFVFFSHHSACQKCFFTAKCSPSQGGPIPLERLNICNQTHSAQEKNVFLQPSVLRVKADQSHLSGSTYSWSNLPKNKMQNEL